MKKTVSVIASSTKKFKTCRVCGEQITDIRVSYLSDKDGEAPRHVCIKCLADHGEKLVQDRKFDRLIEVCKRLFTIGPWVAKNAPKKI